MKSSILSSAAIALATTASLASAQARGNIECFNGRPNTIQASDISALINALRTTNRVGTVSNPIDLRSILTIGRASAVNLFSDSVSVSIRNGQPFSSTHVSFASAARALQDLMRTCCGSFPTCIGGTTGVAGDTGLVVDITMSPRSR